MGNHCRCRHAVGDGCTAAGYSGDCFTGFALENNGKIGVSPLFYTYSGGMLVSYFANNVLPLRTASFVTFLKSIFQINSNPGKDEGNDADKSISCKKGGIDPGHIMF